MSADRSESSARVVREFVAAWKRRDVDALMELMAEDCVYSASVGPEPGATFVGRDEVRVGFERLLAFDDGAEPEPGEVFACGERVVGLWGYTRRREDGRSVTVRGCDIFVVRDGLVVRKDAFRKTLA